MCGITGVVSFRDNINSEKLALKGIETLNHRGPDATSVWSHSNVALGHARLSIIDTRVISNQPMENSHGHVIVFNGEIYNYKDLKCELADSYKFITNSDTEVILAAYAKWGPDCVKKFNGDWAFAIYDKNSQELFLSRDRFGVKPLYYSKSSDGFIFASELKALFAMGNNAEMSISALMMMLHTARSELDENTPYKGIYTLLPGHSIRLTSSGVITFFEYWGENELFEYHPSPRNLSDAQDRFYELLSDSVKIRLQSDVPIGVALSGGLDSSLISSIAQRLSPNQIMTFSGIAKGYQSDESYYSQLVADRIESAHYPIDLGERDIFDAISRYVYVQESSTRSMNSIARYFLLQEASKSVKVILDGQGGDELLCGYLRFNKIYNKAFGGKLEEKEVDNTLVLNPLMELKKEFYGDYVALKPYKPLPKKKLDPVSNALYQSLRGSGLLSLLHTEDRLTMSHSMEGRVPFLDHRLVEFCFSCPLEMKIGEITKLLMRRVAIMENLLPHEVISRKDKKGFSSPYAQKYLEDCKFRKKMKEFVLDTTSKYDHIFDRNALEVMTDSEHVDYSSRLTQIATTAVLLDTFNITISA